jgi:translation initiation factor 1
MRRRATAKDGDLVYSTEPGAMCPTCGRAVAGCVCKRQKAAPAGDGVVRVGRETKGRKGKGVTVITGVPLDAASVLQLATRLKRRCGSGGTVKDGVIEIQGDHRDAVVAALQREGWTVRRAGG